MTIQLKEERQTRQEAPALPRRDFLRFGLALATGAGIARAGLAAPSKGRLPVEVSAGFSGGASDGISAVVTPATIANVALGYWPSGASSVSGVSPADYPVGDSAFELSGANLRVYGSRSGIAGARQALLLNFFPEGGNGDALPVVAWAAGETAMSSGTVVPNQPGAACMQVPLQTAHANQGTLALTAVFGETRTPVVLATGATRGAMKLQAGTYVIAAPAPVSSTLPDLTRWTWKSGDRAGGLGTLGALTAPSTVAHAPNFPYIVVEISYGALD